MAGQWYYTKAGQRCGPISDEQLRGLAASGQLQPTDLVWSKGMAKWTPARNINGLTFASPAAQSPQAAAPTTASPLGFLDSLQETSVAAGKQIAQTATEAVKRGAAAGTKNKLWENPYFIGVLLFFCWPVGLIFAWLHPTWKKQTKWVVTGIFVGLMVIGVVASHAGNRRTSGGGSANVPVVRGGSESNTGGNSYQYNDGYKLGTHHALSTVATVKEIKQRWSGTETFNLQMDSTLRAAQKTVERWEDNLRHLNELIDQNGGPDNRNCKGWVEAAENCRGLCDGFRETLAKEGVSL